MPDLIATETDGILWLSINRPAKASSISRAVTDAYAEALASLHEREDLKGAIWTSASATLFSGGVDLKRPEGLDDQQASEYRTAIITDLLMATLTCPRPIVTMTQGRMIGGAFLNALVCDRIVAAEGAVFQLPEVRIGMGSPIAAAVVEGATHAGLAYDLLLSAREIPAERLEEMGGPCTTVPQDALAARAVETLESLAAMPREAFGYMKRWFQAPRIEALEHAIRFTAETRRGRNSEVTGLVEKFFEKT
ncbi:enoyl-CoA hydratase/isomerase family protein [uncultured Albimonas sp.]|uniref:enoyl-CoA hydratase/isomerase family protein n=1 Tax=uncultured Albimonas sp. TaxID=1331701 RepID=UPI0030EB56AE